MKSAVVLLMLALSGCGQMFENRARKLTSPEIGCAPDAIQIKDRDGWTSGATFTAVCQRKEYYCRMVYINYAEVMQCARKRD